MDDLLNSVQRLKEGLEFFDQYEPVPSDDEFVYAYVDESLHEFAADDGAFKVGDLRNILQLCKQHGLVLENPNANS